jgi:hypothetical protein
VSVTIAGKKAARVGQPTAAPDPEAVEPPPAKKKRSKGKKRRQKKPKSKPPPPKTPPKESDGSGDYERTLNLEEGENSVEVIAKDDVGNESKIVMKVTIDTTPPDLEVTMTPLKEKKALIKGKVEKGAKVSVDGKILDVNFFGEFSIEVRGDPDKKTVTIIAVDEHGNETLQKRRIKDGAVVK